MTAPVVKLTIIMPVLNEATGIVAALDLLQEYRERGVEVIVADGGSADSTAQLAAPLCDRVVTSPRGRALQMNTGAASARGGVLLFLHADTQLPANADRQITEGLAQSGRVWGRFDVKFDGDGALRLVARAMNMRSRATGIATGDQAMFLTRAAFEQAGGFPPIALMEDIALSTSLKRIGPPLCLSARVTTSGQRWRANGTVRTVLLMWRLRLAYFFGADPEKLARAYGYR